MQETKMCIEPHVEPHVMLTCMRGGWQAQNRPMEGEGYRWCEAEVVWKMSDDARRGGAPASSTGV